MNILGTKHTNDNEAQVRYIQYFLISLLPRDVAMIITTRSGEDGLTFENRRSMISAHALHDQWSERTRERRVNIESKTTSRRQGSQQEDAAADCHGSRKRETGVWRLGDGASRITVAEPVSFVDFRRDRAILFLPVHPRDEREKTYSTDVVSHWARVTHWKTSGRARAHTPREPAYNTNEETDDGRGKRRMVRIELV